MGLSTFAGIGLGVDQPGTLNNLEIANRIIGSNDRYNPALEP